MSVEEELEKLKASGVSREALINAVRFTAQQCRAYDDDKLLYYKPHGFQEEFHKSNHFIRIVLTGNRAGKSTATLVEGGQLALGLHPYHPIPVPNKGKFYGESFGLLNKSLVQKIDEWIPRKYLARVKPFEKNPDGNIIGVNFACGSSFTFGTYDQQVKKAESADYDWVAFDEPPPRDVWIANLRGLIDRGGRAWIAATPLSEAWVLDDLWLPGIQGKKKYIKCISGTTYDNPHLNRKVLEIFAEELTDDEKQVRLYGKFLKLKGLVMETYEPDLSDVDPFILDSSFTLYEGIDPHPGKPNAALWKAIDEDGIRYVVAELKCDKGIYQFGKEVVKVRKRLREHGALFYRSIADTSLNQKDLAFRINQRDEFIRSLQEEGETVFPSNAQKKDWLDAGIAKMKDLYRPVIQVIDGQEVREPMEYVFANCTEYKKELTHYQWPKGDLAENAKPIAKYNDLIDCNRYIESIAPEYQTPGNSSFINIYNGAYQKILPIDRYFNEPRSAGEIKYSGRKTNTRHSAYRSY